MKCKRKLFISRACDIPLTIADGNSLSVDDISDISLTLTLSTDESTNVTFTKSGGGISISGSSITLLILESSVVTEGIYNIAIDVTDTGGKVRGVTPCPPILKFYTQ